MNLGAETIIIQAAANRLWKKEEQTRAKRHPKWVR